MGPQTFADSSFLCEILMYLDHRLARRITSSANKLEETQLNQQRLNEIKSFLNFAVQAGRVEVEYSVLRVEVKRSDFTRA